MVFFSACIYALLANLDALAVGLSYGVKKIKIRWEYNLLIASVGAVGTAISIYLGQIICNIIPYEFSRIIGASLLILIGLWWIIKLIFFKKEDIYDHPEKYDKDESGTIDFKESIMLALVLAINNFVLGIGMGIVGINVPLTLVLTFALSIGAIGIGQLLKQKYRPKFIEKYSEYLASGIMILIGLHELFF